MTTIETLCKAVADHGPIDAEAAIAMLMDVPRIQKASRRSNVLAALRRAIYVGWIERAGDTLTRTSKPIDDRRPFIPLARELLQASGGKMLRDDLIDQLEQRGIDRFRTAPNVQIMTNRGLLRMARVDGRAWIMIGRGVQKSIPFAKGGQPLLIAQWIDRAGSRSQEDWLEFFRRGNRDRIQGARKKMHRAGLIEIVDDRTRLTQRGQELLEEVLGRARERSQPLDNDEAEEPPRITADAEKAWAQRMAGRRFEDHPRARQTFQVRRIDRPATLGPDRGTAAQCEEAFT
jgi:DNA-binding PadR family transcriptional regulator